MAQSQKENDTLLCTHKDCKHPQDWDSEFCEDHTPSNTQCPLCEGKMIYHAIEHSYKVTHIYVCYECPFVGFEYLNQENLNDLDDYLNRKK